MKNIEKYLILVISLLVIGSVGAAIYFAFNGGKNSRNDDSVNELFKMNYVDYPYVSIQKQYEIINTAKELDELLNEATENNPKNAEMIGKIRNKYSSYNFDKYQLIVLNTSGSGCDYGNIKSNFNLDIEGDALIVKYNTNDHVITCARYMKQITVVEIPAKNINTIEFLR